MQRTGEAGRRRRHVPENLPVVQQQVEIVTVACIDRPGREKAGPREFDT